MLACRVLLALLASIHTVTLTWMSCAQYVYRTQGVPRPKSQWVLIYSSDTCSLSTYNDVLSKHNITYSYRVANSAGMSNTVTAVIPVN
jgi:hypothetical protein